MAKFLDKDPYSYEREKREFLHALRQYHATKGVQPAMFRMPKISGKDLDLYLLYSRVTALGGIVKVTNDRNWDAVCEVFGYPPGCSQIAYVVRQLYIRYLEAYEKVHFKGEDDDELRGKRPHTPISFAYRREISDKVRKTHGFAQEKCRTSEYDRIVYSLQSGLPNEVDFAVNICTLLSNEGKHVIHLERAPLLIDLLLAHAGVFYEGPGSLRKLYEEDWACKTKRRFVQFWYDTVSDKEVREVIGPSSKKPEDKREFKDPELFCVRKMGLSDVEGQRILQIAIIFRNLSFEVHNIETMAAHRTLYRFLLLLVHNSCTMLQQLGLDTLTNICNQIVLDSIDYVSTQLMLHTIHKGLLSQTDKFVALRSMELMQKLLCVDHNLDLFQRCLEPSIYVRVTTLLTVQDIQLLLGALEVLLVMSEREEPFCTRMATVHRSVDVLVCLITLDAQSLGAEAFVGIKIVDHAPDGIHHPIVTMGGLPSGGSGGGGGAPSLGHSGSQPRPQHQHQSPAKPNTPPGLSPRLSQAQSAPSASPTPPPSSHTSQVKEADMENLACQWLGAHYDTNPESSISNIDLYAEYLSTCGKIMGRNILNSNDFMRCVKMVFPMVEAKRTEREAGPQFLVIGIQRRRVPLPWKWTANQSAPAPAGTMAASAMIARMAQRHSPSPTVSPSPPPPKGGIFHQGLPHRQLVAPPVHVQAQPQPPQAGPPLPGQVNGQIPGHIHGPIVQALAPGPAIPQNQGMVAVQQTPVGLAPAQNQGPTPGQILGQTGQLPPQMQMQMPGSGHVMGPGPGGLGGVPGQGQGAVVGPRVLPVGGNPIPQMHPQTGVLQQPMAHGQGQHTAPGVVAQSIAGPTHPQAGVPTSIPAEKPALNPPTVPNHTTPGALMQQQQVSHVSQGDNVSVADIVAGNMRVPQQEMNYGLQQAGCKPTNGQGAPEQMVLNGHQNYSGVHTAVRQNSCGSPSIGSTIPPVGNGLPVSSPLVSSSIPANHKPELHAELPSLTNNDPHNVQSSDTNSECSSEVSLKSKKIRSRSNSGKKSTSSNSNTLSRASEKPPKSPKGLSEDASTEKCQPPLKVPLPDGEVRIEKIPNVHAMGVDEDEEDGNDRTDLAEGIIRQIAGSPVLNQNSCDIPMEESESVVSEAETNEESVQHHGMNGDTLSSPDLPQQQQMATADSTMSETVPINQAGVFTQQQPSQVQVNRQYHLAANGNQTNAPLVMAQSQPQQQIVIQQQYPGQTVVSRGVVNVQMHGGQGTVLQTQPGTLVQTHSVSGPVVRTTQGTVIQAQSGNFVQMQPQLHVQGHQTVIHNQANFQGQQYQSQVPLKVTLVQQPMSQGQGQQHVPQQQLNMVTGMQHIQPGQTMIMTNSAPQGNFAQATFLSQNSGQLVVQNVQNVNGPPRTGPKPILPQPPPGSTMSQGPRPILPQLQQVSQPNLGMGQVQNIQITRPIQHYQAPITSVQVQQVQQVQGSPQGVQITRFPGMQMPLSPTNRDSPLIKRLLQQGPVLAPQGGQPGQQQQPQQQPQQQQQQQQQVQVMQPQHGQIVLNAIGQAQGAPMTVQTQGQPMPLSHVQVVTQFPTVSVQTASTIANIPQIQLHHQHQPILPALPGMQSPNRNFKDTKAKKNHKSKHKKKDKGRDKNKNGSARDDQAKGKMGDGHLPEKDGKNYSVHVISEQGDKKVVGVVWNGLPVDARTDINKCNNSDSDAGQNQGSLAKQGLPNGYVSDKFHSDVKLASDGIVSPLASNDIESLLKKTPQTIGDKVDSVVEQLKRDMSSSAENGILADKLGKPCLNHVINGDVAPLLKDSYDSNKTVSDRLDKLLHGAVPNLSQTNIPNTSTPNPKSHMAFCHDARTGFPSTVPSVTVGAVANANNNNQQNTVQSAPGPVGAGSADGQAASLALSQRTQNAVNQSCNPEVNAKASSVPQGAMVTLSHGSVPQSAVTQQTASQPTLAPQATVSQGMLLQTIPQGTLPQTTSQGTILQVTSSQALPGNPTPTTSSQACLPLPAQHPSSPLTVQVPNPSSSNPCFKRPIDDVLHSPDAKLPPSSNPLSSPTNPAPTPPSPSTPRSHKKRRHSSSSSTSSSSRKSGSSSGKGAASAPPPPPVQKYICEWKGCCRKLGTAKALHTHVCLAHVLTVGYRGLCDWEGCDRIQRQRWSVVSHIMDKHCSEAAVQAAVERRAQRAAQPTPPPSQDSSPLPPPIVYNAHTAYHAIRRSLSTPSLKEFLGENEGPVTKSIRLTAALILKNLAKHSAVGRSEIRKHELLLARLAISNTESSTTLAKCLKELDRDS